MEKKYRQKDIEDLVNLSVFAKPTHFDKKIKFIYTYTHNNTELRN